MTTPQKPDSPSHKQPLQAVVLAGGLGTRMRTVSTIHKVLLPVGSQTFVDCQLKWLKLLGVTHVVMCLGHDAAQVQTHLEKAVAESDPATYPQLVYSYDGDTLLGTSGAIGHAASLLNENFIVTYGDTFLTLNLRAFYYTHVSKGHKATLSIFENKNQGDKSNVIFENGTLVLYDKFHTDPRMHYIDYGMCVLNKSYFLENTDEGHGDLADFLCATSVRGDLKPFVATVPFREIGSPAGYENFCNFLKKHQYSLDRVLTSYHQVLTA